MWSRRLTRGRGEADALFLGVRRPRPICSSTCGNRVSPFLAHREIFLQRKTRSACGHDGHRALIDFDFLDVRAPQRYPRPLGPIGVELQMTYSLRVKLPVGTTPSRRPGLQTLSNTPPACIALAAALWRRIR